MRFVGKLLLTTLAFLLAERWLPGFSAGGLLSAFFMVVVLGLINVTVRPVLVLLTIPVTILTLGLFLLVINTLCVIIAAALVPGVDVENFLTAFLIALIASAAGYLGNRLWR